MSEVGRLPAKAEHKEVPQIMAGGPIRPIIPQSAEEAYRIADAVIQSGLAPKDMSNPQSVMIAIMHGLEIGLPPMMALQKIAIINGRPTLWGDGALGLVRGSGKCRYVKEEIIGEGDDRQAVCEVMRIGESAPIVRAFSVEDAKRAGLWDPRDRVTRKNKNGGSYDVRNDSPWHKYPNRMLQMRARAFALRDGFADVLGGMYLTEELQGDDNAQPSRGRPYQAAQPTQDLIPPPAPPAPAASEVPPTSAPSDFVPLETDPPGSLSAKEELSLDRKAVREADGTGDEEYDSLADWLSDMIADAKTAKSQAELDELDEQVCRETDDRPDLRARWNDAYSGNAERFTPKGKKQTQ